MKANFLSISIVLALFLLNACSQSLQVSCPTFKAGNSHVSYTAQKHAPKKDRNTISAAKPKNNNLSAAYLQTETAATPIATANIAPLQINTVNEIQTASTQKSMAFIPANVRLSDKIAAKEQVIAMTQAINEVKPMPTATASQHKMTAKTEQKVAQRLDKLVKKAEQRQAKIAQKATNKQEKTEKAGVTSGGKSQVLAALLAWFLGLLGIHRFYLGYAGIGLIQLFTLGGLGIWALIDLIRIIIGDLKPKNGSYN